MAQEFKEKTIIVNLRKVFDKPTTKRAINAKHVLKQIVEKETRLKKILISNGVNELIWARGKFNSPRKIKVKIIKEKDTGRVMLPEEKYETKQENKKDTKTEKKQETTEKKE
jgi:ribosomal protein L31E